MGEEKELHREKQGGGNIIAMAVGQRRIEDERWKEILVENTGGREKQLVKLLGMKKRMWLGTKQGENQEAARRETG